jgi:hypothetical protein
MMDKSVKELREELEKANEKIKSLQSQDAVVSQENTCVTFLNLEEGFGARTILCPKRDGLGLVKGKRRGNDGRLYDCVVGNPEESYWINYRMVNTKKGPRLLLEITGLEDNVKLQDDNLIEDKSGSKEEIAF